MATFFLGDNMQRANLWGIGAIILWGALALLTNGTKGIAPFYLCALSFGIGGVFLFICEFIYYRRIPILPFFWQAIFTISGLFLYHFFYFIAIHGAPPAHISLIAYLWPLLIVVMNAIINKQISLPILGAALASFIAVGMVINSASSAEFSAEFQIYYAIALLCALIWSGYSVANAQVPAKAQSSISYACMAVAILSFISHYFLESPQEIQQSQWIFVVLLGLGPVGLAFLWWDIATKGGNMALLGIMANIAPILSIILLVISGVQEYHGIIIIAALIISICAALAQKYTKQ